MKISAGQELVVGGRLRGKGRVEGRVEGRLGSPLIGYHDDDTPGEDELRYAGRVGSGIDERDRRQLEDALRGRARAGVLRAPGLPGAVWVDKRAAEVARDVSERET